MSNTELLRDDPLPCPECGNDSYNIEYDDDEEGAFQYATLCAACCGEDEDENQ